MRPRRLVPLWIVLLDVVLINVSMVLAYWVRYRLQWFRDISFFHPMLGYIPVGLIFTLLMLIAFRVDHVYQNWRNSPWLDQVYRLTNATAKSVVVLLALTFILQPLSYSRLLLIEAGIIALLLLSVARAVQGTMRNYLRGRGMGVERVIIVGAGEIGRTVMRTIVAKPHLGYAAIGFVDDDAEKCHTPIGRFRALGPLANLPRLLEQERPDQVIITLPWTFHRKILDIVHECQSRGVEPRIVPDLFQMSLSRVDVNDLGGVPLIGVRDVAFSRTAILVKRILDIALATFALSVGLPILALIALAIRLDSPGPIIFRQTRVGQGGRPFEMYKFRSMRQGSEAELEELLEFNEAEGPWFKMRRDPRLTRVGQLLRRTSLDELPQLWNVLRGEMSIVGPRPPLPSEVEQYLEWHRKRLQVLPGITGLWQVSGRSLLSFDEMVLLDIHYIENWSLWLDLKILLMTIPQVLLGRGAY